MAKYHINKRGYYSPCTAGKRSCPLGANGHITQTQFDTIKAEGNNPAIATQVKAAPDSYFTKAKENFENLNKQAYLGNKVHKEVAAFEAKLLDKEGLEPGAFLYAHKAQGLKADALKQLKTIYTNEGVAAMKATFMTEDIAKQPNGIKPVIRKKDKLDPDIEAKTTRAVEAAKNDADFQKIVKEYEEANKKAEAYRRVSAETDKFKRALVLKYAGPRAYSLPVITDSHKQQVAEAYRTAINWKSAGIPDEAEATSTSRIRPDSLSVNSQGKINNAWVQMSDGSVERIVGYEAPQVQAYGISGNLISEKGTKVSSHTHYANYRSAHSGINHIILGGKKGADFVSDNFSVHSSIDSGD